MTGYSKCKYCNRLVYVKNDKYFCGHCGRVIELNKEKDNGKTEA